MTPTQSGEDAMRDDNQDSLLVQFCRAVYGDVWSFAEIEYIKDRWPHIQAFMSRASGGVTVDDAPNRAWNEAIEAAAREIKLMTERHCDPNGTDYQQGGQDHGNRMYHAIKRLTRPTNDGISGKLAK